MFKVVAHYSKKKEGDKKIYIFLFLFLFYIKVKKVYFFFAAEIMK